MATKIGRPTGPEGAKSTLLTLRLTPKMRFGLEMQSRLRHTSIPELVTRAIKDLFESENEGLWDYPPGQSNAGDGEPNGPRYLLDVLWAEKPSDRFANIAFNCSNLMTLDESRLWSHITSQQKFWSHKTRRTEKDILRDVLERDWDAIKAEYLPTGW